jgi:DNA-binding XRE family transcriptional regulator
MVNRQTCDGQYECDSSDVYASAVDRQDAGRWRSTSASVLGRAVRRVREEQKINQEEAAERCGLHRTYYSGVERGVRNVSLVNIEKIARGLKKSRCRGPPQTQEW